MDQVQIAFWHWWVAAVLLVLMEMFVPGAALILLGIAAAITGLALLVVPDMAWQAQFGLFALLSIAFIAVARLMPRRAPAPTDEPHLNRRAEQYAGRTVTLESPILNGRGRAFVGDTLWSVTGPDLPAGTRVRIIGAEGALLQVEAEAPAQAMPHGA